MVKLGEFASSYEEQEYQCRECLAMVPHERHAIKKHMASKHGLTMVQYESTHENTQQPAAALEEMPEKHKEPDAAETVSRRRSPGTKGWAPHQG